MRPPTLLLPDWLIPIRPENQVQPACGLALIDGRIADIGAHATLLAKYPDATVERLDGCALLPGFVNLHSHAGMSLLRGAGDDMSLMPWLQTRIWPLERKLVSPDFVYDGSALAFAEMLIGGTTCAADMYFFPDEVARAALATGIRACVGMTVLDFPTPYAADAGACLELGRAAHDAYRGDPALRFMFAPHAPYTVGDDTLRLVGMLAEQLDVPIAIHLQETRDEVEQALASTGMRPVQRLARLGLLSPRLIGVHGVYLDGNDISLLASHGAHIAHCPASNLKLASGIAPIAQLLRDGVNFGIGTDGSASNNRLDMLAEMRLAALLAKGASGDAKALSAHQSLRAATLGGAQALGWESEIGTLEIGKRADLVAIRLDTPRLMPVFDAASQVVYAAGREDVDQVWVNGMQVAKKLQLTKISARIELERILSRIPQWHALAVDVISGTNPYVC